MSSVTLPKSILTDYQVKTFEKIDSENPSIKYVAKIQYDDSCTNGHNTFSLTMDTFVYGVMEACGCQHERIAVLFPHLKDYIKWHLVSSIGPMHYIANSLYRAGGTDCLGLRKGEFSSFVYKVCVSDNVVFTSKVFCPLEHDWSCSDNARKDAESFLAIIKPELSPSIVCIGHGDPSEGKKADLEAARSSDVWPDAGLPDFTKDKLINRLPSLMRDFKDDIVRLGFIY